jgi:type IV pilus assembly protein PilE
MFKGRNRRSGFTLPEVLVTVAIVAVLAAMVVPAVTQQLGKGDAPAFNTSVASLSTAVTSFVADVRKLPGKVDDLQTKPTAGTDFDLSADGVGAAAGVGSPVGTAFTTTVVNRWKGPYENSGNATGVIPIGYGWSTTNAMYDSLNYIVVAMSQSSADSTDALALDVAVDNSTGPNAGRIRWKTATAGAAPLTPANTIRLFLMSSAR